MEKDHRDCDSINLQYCTVVVVRWGASCKVAIFIGIWLLLSA
jgi:hypothetical protein